MASAEPLATSPADFRPRCVCTPAVGEGFADRRARTNRLTELSDLFDLMPIIGSTWVALSAHRSRSGMGDFFHD